MAVLQLRLVADQPGKGGLRPGEARFGFKRQPKKRPGAEFDAIRDAARVRCIEPQCELGDLGARVLTNSACHADFSPRIGYRMLFRDELMELAVVAELATRSRRVFESRAANGVQERRDRAERAGGTAGGAVERFFFTRIQDIR